MLEFKDILRPFGTQGFLIGIGVSALAYIFAPQIKENLRPAAVKGAQGLLAVGNETKRLFKEGKDKIAGVFAEKAGEAKEKLRFGGGDKGFSSILQELKEERELSNKIMEELKNSIVSLREEISGMRNGAGFQQG